MERRFKLIKTYPWSPDLGYVNRLDTKLCEKYPEFWEEIFPVAFKHKSGGIFIWDDDRDRYLDLKGYGEYWTYDRSFFDNYPNLIQELYWHESDIPGERTPAGVY